VQNLEDRFKVPTNLAMLILLEQVRTQFKIAQRSCGCVNVTCDSLMHDIDAAIEGLKRVENSVC
jgi:hypothetical protein